MKRFIWMLLFVPLAAYSQPLAIGTSLAADPGFENGLTSWTENWNPSATMVTVNPLAGTKSLRLTTSPGGRAQIITNIEPGARYHVSGIARLAKAGEMATIGIQFEDPSGQNIYDQWIQVPSTSTQAYGFDIQAPANSVIVYLYAFKNSGNGAADFDNIDLVKIADK